MVYHIHQKIKISKMTNKRAFFNDDQKAILAKSYDNSPYPTSAQREALATLMKKPTKQIGNWFKNERARQLKNQNGPIRPTRNLALKNIVEVKEENKSIILEKIVTKEPISVEKESIVEKVSIDFKNIPSVQSDVSAVPSLETIPEIPISPFTEEEINVSVSESSLKDKITSTPLPEQKSLAANDTFSKSFVYNFFNLKFFGNFFNFNFWSFYFFQFYYFL